MRHLLPNPWLLAIGVTIFSYLVIYGIKRIFTVRLGKFTGKTKNGWDDIVVQTVEQTSHLFMLGVAFYIAFKFVPHHKKFDVYANKTFFILCMLQSLIWLNHLINIFILSFINKKMRKNPAVASSISLIQLMSKLLLLSVVFLFTLHNLGINITTILAGLGVGGIAVALALQKILGDLFSSLSIVMDKPFMVGDFIVLDQYMGEVEKIGLKTTRIRSLGGEQIIISNSDLLATRIRNFQRLHERRVPFTISLPHDSTSQNLKQAVSLISAVVNSKPQARLERCHFMSITRTSMDIETVYWAQTEDYNIHMDILQDILMDINTAFKQENITVAYPTQKVQIHPNEFFMRTDGEKIPPLATEDKRSIS